MWDDNGAIGIQQNKSTIQTIQKNIYKTTILSNLFIGSSKHSFFWQQALHGKRSGQGKRTFLLVIVLALMSRSCGTAYPEASLTLFTGVF